MKESPNRTWTTNLKMVRLIKTRLLSLLQTLRSLRWALLRHHCCQWGPIPAGQGQRAVDSQMKTTFWNKAMKEGINHQLALMKLLGSILNNSNWKMIKKGYKGSTKKMVYLTTNFWGNRENPRSKRFRVQIIKTMKNLHSNRIIITKIQMDKGSRRLMIHLDKL